MVCELPEKGTDGPKHVVVVTDYTDVYFFGFKNEYGWCRLVTRTVSRTT